MRETNGTKQVVMAYAKQWEKVWKSEATTEDIDALVKCLNDEYELVGKIMQMMEQSQFQQWLEKTTEKIVRYSEIFTSIYRSLPLIESSLGRHGELPKRIASFTNISALLVE